MAALSYPTRSGKRLVQPDYRTIENYDGTNLQITVYVPYDRILRFLQYMPTGGGPDTLTIVYTDTTGFSSTLVTSLRLWTSDGGYIFVSADGLHQVLVSNVNGAFYDAVAAAVNARNVTAAAAALEACGNASRYGYCKIMPNQVRPTVFIRDGISLTQGV